ncbi:hypothetical protein VULLAG_LOCUS17086 [Vulpes lagopus]
MADDAGAADGPGGPGGPGGPEGPEGPEWEAAAASGFRRGFASGIRGRGRGRGRAEVAELAEARRRTRSGSPSPSWARLVKDRKIKSLEEISFLCPSRNLRSLTSLGGIPQG